MNESLDIWKQTLAKLNDGLDLATDEIQAVMRQILQGSAETEDVKSFLLALKAKGETAEEATDFYMSVFKNAKRGVVARYLAGMEPNKDGAIMFTDFMCFTLNNNLSFHTVPKEGETNIWIV